MSEQTNELEDLNYTRDVRKVIVSSMISGNEPPKDAREKAILLQALADMDRATLGKMRIKVDEGVGNAQAAVASFLSQLFVNPDLKKVGVDDSRSGSVPELDPAIAPSKLVDGELDTSSKSESYDEFIKRTTFKSE